MKKRAAANGPARRRRGRRGPGAILEAFSLKATQWAGSSWAFACAVGVLVVWGVTGPIFGYSDTWQLVINTGTTIVTFLMVFLIQRAQNKESKAIQLKLNELVAALQGASNHLIDVESLTETEIDGLHAHYSELARLASAQDKVLDSHSIEEAKARSDAKTKSGRRVGG